MPWCRPCQSVGKASLAAAVIVVTAALILIFLFDLPGGDDVGPGPMNKYKIITTHFQVSRLMASVLGKTWLAHAREPSETHLHLLLRKVLA